MAQQRPMVRSGKGTRPAGPPPFKTQAALKAMLGDFGTAGVQARARDQQLMQAALTMAQQKQEHRDALEAHIRSGPIGAHPEAENDYLKVCEELRLLEQAIANGHKALGPVDHPLQRPAGAAPVTARPGAGE